MMVLNIYRCYVCVCVSMRVCVISCVHMIAYICMCGSNFVILNILRFWVEHAELSSLYACFELCACMRLMTKVEIGLLQFFQRNKS